MNGMPSPQTTQTYIFASLDPRPEDKVPAAAEANAKVFGAGAPVYGIEVTSPPLSKRCSFNLDPQHGPTGDPRTSAIEAALTVDLPAPGSIFATVRPDKDSIGAMAVLALRAAGKSEQIDNRLVAAIGRMDGLGPQARDLKVVQENQEAITASDYVCFDRKLTIDQKVDWMSNLLIGEVSDAVIGGFAFTAREELEKAKASLQVSVLPGNRVGIVVGNSPRGFDVGYATGVPVVIAFSPSFLRPGAGPDESPVQKWTVARYSSAAPLDMAALKARLSELEQGWGGPADLVASPQGMTSAIPAEKIIALVLEALINS
ncbi:hypothetical protein HYW32_01740 [Candidatus Berkelbacteria bacterium]|nr:hypothetical protein [Candidatus Berkelbacteria bacterium]